MKILLLYDLLEPFAKPEHANAAQLQRSGRDGEAQTYRALKRLGHSVDALGLYSLSDLIECVRRAKPDIVFNAAESIYGNRRLESHVAVLLEAMNVPFTGCTSQGLAVCRDKALTKLLLQQAGLPTAEFMVISRNASVARLPASLFPAVVKPIDLDASEGIHAASLAMSSDVAVKQISMVKRRFSTNVLVEKYISGRELYLYKGPVDIHLPAREMLIVPRRPALPLLTYAAKWNELYRSRNLVRFRFANLSSLAQRKAAETARVAYRTLGLTGLMRLDVKLTPSGEIIILEANPNPPLQSDDGIGLSAKKAGISFDALVAALLAEGLRRAH